jgi:predicted nucleic acid-binding protein
MNAIDTNIWLYSHDVREKDKQRIAQELIESVRSLALPWQVGCEFIAASRKLSSAGFSESEAWDALDAMQILADVVLLPTVPLWNHARNLQADHSLSLWDGLLVASCLRGGVRVLYTEDMGAPRIVAGLWLVNPFLVVPPA